MKKEYIPNEHTQEDLIKTTDECVDFVFEQGKSFISRNNIPQESLASIPMSVAFTIINSIIKQSDSKESLEYIKVIIMGNIEQMFRNAGLDQSKLH